MKKIFIPVFASLISISTAILAPTIAYSALNSAQATEYLNVINEFEKNYGALYKTSYDDRITSDDRSKGVVYTDLIDFDGDGIEELYILIAHDEASDYPDSSGAAIEKIYTLKNGKATEVYDDFFYADMNHRVSHVTPRKIVYADGKAYLVNSGYYGVKWLDGIEVLVHEFDGNTFNEIIDLNILVSNGGSVGAVGEENSVTITLNDNKLFDKVDPNINYDNKYNSVNEDVMAKINPILDKFNTPEKYETIINIAYYLDVQWEIKNIKSELQSMANGTTTTTTPTTYAGFTDVSSSDWFAPFVSFVSENNIMTGSNSLFSPNTPATRGEVAQAFYNLSNSQSYPKDEFWWNNRVPANKGNHKFTDVSSSPNKDAIAWCFNEGIVNGVSDNSFSPNTNITREQVAIMILNFWCYLGYESGDPNPIEGAGFSDVKNVSDWANFEMSWCVDWDIIKGDNKNMLNPKQNVTNAELATMIKNFNERLNKL